MMRYDLQNRMIRHPEMNREMTGIVDDTHMSLDGKIYLARIALDGDITEYVETVVKEQEKQNTGAK